MIIKINDAMEEASTKARSVHSRYMYTISKTGKSMVNKIVSPYNFFIRQEPYCKPRIFLDIKEQSPPVLLGLSCNQEFGSSIHLLRIGIIVMQMTGNPVVRFDFLPLRCRFSTNIHRHRTPCTEPATTRRRNRTRDFSLDDDPFTASFNFRVRQWDG